MSALLVALVLQAPVLAMDAFTHPARRVREAAIARAAAGPATSADLLAYLDHADSRVARAVIAVLLRRLDEDALPALARCGEHRDTARAEEAARTAVAIALHHQVDLEDLSFDGMRSLPARIQRAVDADIEACLPRIRGRGHTHKTQNYRRFFAGGRYAARALERISRDRTQVEHVREHALYGLAMLSGFRFEDTLLDLLDDAMPRVRVACCSLIYQYGTTPSMRKLARRLDGVRMHQEHEITWIVAAVERTGVLSAGGAKKLERLVRDGVTNRALGAAAALRRTRPETFLRAVRERVQRLLGYEAGHPDAASEVALFELRVGPLEDDLRARMRRSRNPLVSASAQDDSAQALRVLAAVIAPKDAVGSLEATRTRIVSRLLALHQAPNEDRVRFATQALNKQHMRSRRDGMYVLGVLRGTGASLRPRLRTLLDDPYGPVRLDAARLLAPSTKAIEVAIAALYDGDHRSARVVRRILRRWRPEWPTVNGDGDTKDRRRLARTLARLHKSVPRGKE